MASSSNPAAREHVTPSLALRRFVSGQTPGPTKEPYLDARIFIPNPSEEGTYILGPQLIGEIPASLSLYYPRLGDAEIRACSNQDWQNFPKKSFPCWPTLDKDWKIWTTRMLAAKSDDLEKVGLKRIITLLRRGVPQNPPLIQAALAFWDPSFNFFRFNCGMMAPTVLDVTQMLGLIPYGPQFDPTKEFHPPEGFTRLTATNGAFSQFYHRERKLVGEVTETEFFAYILYTLCKHIFCHSGKRVMNEFVPLALALARGEEFDFASYFLGHVYKAGFDFYQKGLNHSQGGPQWFIQLWLHAYFPELGPFKAPTSLTGVVEAPNVHGDNYVHPEDSTTQTLVYYLCFFAGLASDREWPNPYPTLVGPTWLFDILADKRGRSSRALQAWGNILTSREILFPRRIPSSP